MQLPSDAALAEANAHWRSDLSADLEQFCEGKRVFLSINRFERKKVRITTCASCCLCASENVSEGHARHAK